MHNIPQTTKLKIILQELKEHSPYTLLGSLSGILFLALFYWIPYNAAYKSFYILHPLHVAFSAMVISSFYRIYTQKTNIWKLLAIGYLGSVGTGTISDSVFPFLGEIALGLPQSHIHAGFIEEWWLVNPAALLGIAVAYFQPRTKLPHAVHLLLSTWASLFHMIMALSGNINLFTAVILFIFLFFSVLLPCCFSDIVFPLLFIKRRE